MPPSQWDVFPNTGNGNTTEDGHAMHGTAHTKREETNKRPKRLSQDTYNVGKTTAEKIAAAKKRKFPGRQRSLSQGV